MPPADKTEKALRFGCGFVFGLVFFGISSIWFVVEDSTYAIAIVIAATVFGLAALRFGDAFWRAFGRWFSWFGI